MINTSFQTDGNGDIMYEVDTGRVILSMNRIWLHDTGSLAS